MLIPVNQCTQIHNAEGSNILIYCLENVRSHLSSKNVAEL
jgi:hypothetical protein